MQLPLNMPARPMRSDHHAANRAEREARSGTDAAIEPAGCCVEVCAPIVGCHCVVSAPFC
jgi:hypothetical protein